MGESGVRRRVLPLLAFLPLAGIALACAPAEEGGPPSSAPAVATSDLPTPLDPEGPREIVLGKLFSPDGSIRPDDRRTSFPRGAQIFLSVESGDLVRGETVAAVWRAPDGSVAERKVTAIGGESYLVFTAPSVGWSPGTGRVAVKLERVSRQEPERDLSFEISP